MDAVLLDAGWTYYDVNASIGCACMVVHVTKHILVTVACTSMYIYKIAGCVIICYVNIYSATLTIIAPF